MLDNFLRGFKAAFIAIIDVIFHSNVNIARSLFIPFVSNRDLERILKKMSDNLSDNKSSLDSKIEEAREALAQTSRVINELEVELNRNVVNLETVKGDYEKFSRLAEVEKSAAAAVLDSVAATMVSGRNKERWINIAISAGTGLVIFIVGIWLGPFITNLLNIGK